MHRPILFFVAALFLARSAQPATPAEDFQRLEDRFFTEAYFRFHPTAGTSDGFHQYDTQLEDFSETERREEAAVLRRYLSEFEKMDASRLPPQTAADRELVIAHIRATLLDLEQIRSWEKNPDLYSGGVTASIFTIMSRTYAPPAERLKSVIARERMIPRVFDEARANLKNPPRIYTTVALEQLPGLLSFFRKDVPAAFRAVHDAALLAEFQASNQRVLAALESYRDFLKNDLLPRSHGDFRIGTENYRRKLAYEEMVDTPLDRLLAVGFEDLRRNQRQFREVAARIDAKRSPQQILEDLEKEHPAPEKLLDTFRGVLGGLRQFIEERGIITIPWQVMPIVEETPPFMRALTFASMDTPGPYEKSAKEAFFNITLPEAGWSATQISEHMAAFNRGTVISTAIHEAYPGHYVQFQWIQQAPSKTRKLLAANSNAEGWAHYCEQMMLDEGYQRNDLGLRLGQLQDALLRDARYIVGIEMHTGKMSFEQGIEFFRKEGYQTGAVAERETKRGTSDPTYLVYTLGKLQILKLRQDYRQMRGGRFRLREFHDRFMLEGAPPIKIIRRALLGNDTPVL
ncbi:MAG TPA: DUF885 domain-containing protein [Bryobacteraceae bacterium]|nr:DUF885 domain-containing protein [Bryobacteraceae bacterium]